MANVEIPNGEILFRYALPEAFPEDQVEIPTSVFNSPELSCDWQKYLPDPSLSPHITAGRSVVINILVCDDIRMPTNARGPVPAWFQQIIHDPLTADDFDGPNEAHSLIKGPKKASVIEALKRNSAWTRL